MKGRQAQPARAGARGFTLLEVLVAIVLVAVGLLGLAKMQALAYGNTQLASVRSLIAFQASSLAAAMHANPNFWTVVNGSPIFTTSGTTVTASGAWAGLTKDCTGSVACSPAELAAYDVTAWARALGTAFPTATSTVSCPASVPVNCTIAISWREKYVAMNATTAASAALQQASATYTLDVLP